MHSGTAEKAGSPRKRVLSRTMSEEESLRHIIKEAEETNKRLSRSDSRYGSLKRGETKESLSEEEHTGNTEMMELQANYEDCLQEVHALELRQEVLLFQVDCLQDALMGTEEMLAETQREAQDANMELEREREKRKKLEDTVALLMKEVERLKEENAVLTESVQSTSQSEQKQNDEVDGDALKDASTSQTSNSAAAAPSLLLHEQRVMGLLTSLFKNRRSDPNSPKQAGFDWFQRSTEGTSVDQDGKEDGKQSEGDCGSVPEGEASPKVQEGEDHDESSGYEDAASELSPASTPDRYLEAGLLEDEEVNEGGEPRSPKNPMNPDSCALS